MSLAGVILAGGKSTRMGGGDKALAEVAGRTLIGHAIDRLLPQVGHLAINANGDPARFRALDLPVIADGLDGHLGPLAGILAGIDWAQALGGITALVSVAADTPFFPRNLVERLATAPMDRPGRIVLASSNGRTHPVFGLWPLGLRDDLHRFMRSAETYRVSTFATLHGAIAVDFPMIPGENGEMDPFFNINTPADLSRARDFASRAER